MFACPTPLKSDYKKLSLIFGYMKILSVVIIKKKREIILAPKFDKSW